MLKTNTNPAPDGNYVVSLVTRARFELKSMRDIERTEFNAVLDNILTLPSPEKEWTFVNFAISRIKARTPARQYVHAA